MQPTRRKFVALLLTTLGSVAWASGAVVAAEDAPPLGLLNERLADEGILSGGQITAEQLAAAKAAGYRTIVNLRPAAEDPTFDEAAKVAELGLEYIYIPISGPADLTEDNARRLLAVWNDPSKKPMVAHCASANRVGALLAVGKSRLEGVEAAAALELGKAAGLTKLEGAVRELLGLPPLPPPTDQPVKPPTKQ